MYTPIESKNLIIIYSIILSVYNSYTFTALQPQEQKTCMTLVIDKCRGLFVKSRNPPHWILQKQDLKKITQEEQLSSSCWEIGVRTLCCCPFIAIQCCKSFQYLPSFIKESRKRSWQASSVRVGNALSDILLDSLGFCQGQESVCDGCGEQCKHGDQHNY